jgi:GT2 family glycosyltransferase
MDPRISVVMVTRNRVDETLRSLSMLGALPERPPIVLVDNASSDGTAAAVRRVHPDVRVVELDENFGSGARNDGVALVDTPYVAFADDDSWWAPGSLSDAADALERHPRLAAVSARVLVGEEAREDPICAEQATSPLPREPDLPGPPIMGFLACALAIRCSAFEQAGGFERRMMIGGEEDLLAADLASAGWALCYLPELTVHHHPSHRRSVSRRRRTSTRNSLWFAWLRRPAPSALRHTARVLGHAGRDRAALAGVVDAVRAAPWVLRGRRVVPRGVEASLRLLESAR